MEVERVASQTFKLRVDLIPKPNWNLNLRNKVSKDEWNKIRKKVYADAGNLCQICGANASLHCDEVWGFDDQNHVQTLIALSATCELCHMVKHFGYSQKTKSKEEVDDLIFHFMNVNGVDRAAFEKHCAEAFSIWEERSKHMWKVVIPKDIETKLGIAQNHPASELSEWL